MSYILDALKKMEREKVKKTSNGGIANISGELYREERVRPSAGGAWKIIVVAIVTACVAMAATWYYLKPHKVSRMVARRNASPAIATPPAPASAVPAPKAPVKPPVPPPTMPQPVPPMLPPAAPAKPSGPATRIIATPAPASAPVRSADNPASRPATTKIVKSLKTHEKPAPRTSPAPRPTVVNIAPPADIKVSGIAWQEERSARRAVINGFLMKEGGMVSGARITEILQDKVRFSTANGVFELSMVAAGVPGATK